MGRSASQLCPQYFNKTYYVSLTVVWFTCSSVPLWVERDECGTKILASGKKKTTSELKPVTLRSD